MIILAVYYTLADIVLLGQCFYYRGFTLRDEVSTPASCSRDRSRSPDPTKPTERTSLLSRANGDSRHTGHEREQHISSHPTSPNADHRRHSILHPSVDGTHLSPATPLIEPSPRGTRPARSISALQTILFNACAIVIVCAAGVLGWYVSAGSKRRQNHHPDPNDSSLHFDPLGQAFGYLCAVFYLGSRLPQLLLNFRRKSTEGVSLLFFLFACIGNLTYVLSILAYSPICEGESGEKEPSCRPGEPAAIYGRYILVNLSWLLGSFGTLLLDMGIFAQFFLYRDDLEDDSDARDDLGA